MKIYTCITLSIVCLIGVFCYFFYFAKSDYSFEINHIQTKNGQSELISNTKPFVNEIKTMNLENKITSENDSSVKMQLTKNQFNKIIHSKKAKKYIISYKKINTNKKQVMSSGNDNLVEDAIRYEKMLNNDKQINQF